MRILRIIATMNPENGGPCEGIRNSIPAMEKMGVYNEVVCFDNPVASYVKNQGFKIHAVGPAKGPYAFCKGFAGWLEENLGNYDVAIIHGLWLFNSYGTWRVWNRLKKISQKRPHLFVMPHGMLDPYFQRTKERRLKAIRNWCFWKMIEEKVVNGADGLLFTCEDELLLARQTFRPYHPRKELNVSYGIKKPPEYTPNLILRFLKKCPALEGRPYWLFLSRIHQKKGVHNLVQAYLELKEIEKDIPDLVIAGPGTQTSYGIKIRKMADYNTIHFPGMLKGPAKWAAFYGCEAFILPSHQENFGIAVVEALACARPVLISNKVNIWREIQAGGAGLIAEDTREGTYRLLKKWMELSESKRSTFASSAGHLYENSFGIDQAAQRMAGCLEAPRQSQTARTK